MLTSLPVHTPNHTKSVVLAGNPNCGKSTIFNALTGFSQPQPFRKIEMAPLGLRDKLLEMIEAETRRRQPGAVGKTNTGQGSHLLVKLDSLFGSFLLPGLAQHVGSPGGPIVSLFSRRIEDSLPCLARYALILDTRIPPRYGRSQVVGELLRKLL